MLTVFEDMHSNTFVRALTGNALTLKEELVDSSKASSESFCHGEIVSIGSLPRTTPNYSSGVIDLNGVPVIAPSGDVVCPSLSIKVIHSFHVIGRLSAT